jgi:hypothetical protein
MPLTILKDELKSFLDAQQLPSGDGLIHLIESSVCVLESEDSSYRPLGRTPDDKQMPGGLLDFSTENSEKLPLVVIPDLHARGDFILNTLEYKLCYKENKDDTLFHLLQKGLVRIVCVGDLLHSESRQYERWMAALKEYQKGNCTGKAMTAEMHEGISLMQMICMLKISFPSNFHFLKGNHENIRNSDEHGDFSFLKFADEGNMVRDFLAQTYGENILTVWSRWEHDLPLCAIFDNCVISHAEPAVPMDREAIINYRIREDVVANLTWTKNDEAAKSSVQKSLENLIGKRKAAHAVWIGGHRPIERKYAFRQSGKYIQIHNPEEENIAVVFPEKSFDPETDMYSVE